MSAALTVLGRVERTSTPRVCVKVADRGDRDVYVELNGRVTRTEHCSDWHRVERRRATLEAELRQSRAATEGYHD
jgi:hypothetical protein